MGKLLHTHSAALQHAIRIIDALSDVVDRIAIAGSVRRGEQQVGDIEIVAQVTTWHRADQLHARLDKWLHDGHVTQRKNKNGHRIAWGPRFRAAVYAGMGLDVFITLPDRVWGPNYLLRTGPSKAKKVLVTGAGMRNHHGDIGVLPADLRFADGDLVRDGVPLPVHEEWQVYYEIGASWVPPPYRTVAMYQRITNPAHQWKSLTKHTGIASPVRCGEIWQPYTRGDGSQIITYRALTTPVTPLAQPVDHTPHARGAVASKQEQMF